MPSTIKTCWLKDKNGDKIAPKTLTSQVQTTDGISLEDKIQSDLDTYATTPINTLDERVDDIEDNVVYIGDAEDDVTIPNGNYNPNCHAKYFQITEDGVLSLKPEYRGAVTEKKDLDPDMDYTDAISDNGIGIAGSRNEELPKHLIIPEIVDGIVVNNLANGMLCNNVAFKYITLPRTITEISKFCFYNSYFIKEIYNTEHITSLQKFALAFISSLSRVNFPNLTSMDTGAICGCADLVYVDLGQATEIPEWCFVGNLNMQKIKNAGKITHIGPSAFSECAKIKYFENFSNIQSVSDTGFWRCGLPYEQQQLLLSEEVNATIGKNAIAPVVNPVDFWSALTYTPCENPLPTYLSELNPLWKNKPLGKELVYGRGCMLFDIIHIYCGLKLLHDNEKIVLNNIEDLENLVNSIDPSILPNYTNAHTHQAEVGKKLGLKVKSFSEFNGETLKELYDGLAAGKYASATVANGGHNSLAGHVVVIYGITSKGELMTCDTGSRYHYDWSKPCLSSMPYQNFLAPTIPGR